MQISLKLRGKINILPNFISRNFQIVTMTTSYYEYNTHKKTDVSHLLGLRADRGHWN